MGIAAILMAIEVLLTGLNMGSRKGDNGHGCCQQRGLGHADPEVRWLAAG